MWKVQRYRRKTTVAPGFLDLSVPRLSVPLGPTDRQNRDTVVTEIAGSSGGKSLSVTHRLAGLAPQLSRGGAIGSPAGQHHYSSDPDVRRRRVLPGLPRTAPRRAHFEGRDRYAHAHQPVRRTNVLRNLIDGHLLHIFAVLVLVSAVAWGVLVYPVYPSPGAGGQPPLMIVTSAANTSVGKTDVLGISTYARLDHSEAVAGTSANIDTESAAGIVAREWSLFQSIPEASRDPTP